MSFILNNVLLIIVLFMVTICVVLAICASFVTRKKNRKVANDMQETTSALKMQGLDTYYERSESSVLLTIYDDLCRKEVSLDFIKDYDETIEINCKRCFIDEILEKRGVSIPEWKLENYKT